MKRLTLKFGVPLAAALIVVAGSSSAPGQGNEFIVGGQVVSDSVSEPGVVSDSYVGDMSMAEGMSGSCQSCGGGSCQSCGGGSCQSCNGKGGLLGKLHNKLHGNCESGGIINRKYGQPDLFFNYYTQGNANRANAQMYLSPMPVPPNVGHTFYTYQPFYPHEMLYWHKDRFHNYYDNGRGMNRTRAVYYSPPIRQAASNIYWNYLRIPR